MNVIKILVELRRERAQIDEAIMALEGLGPRTRKVAWGRPPAWNHGQGEPAKRRGRPLASKTRAVIAAT